MSRGWRLMLCAFAAVLLPASPAGAQIIPGLCLGTVVLPTDDIQAVIDSQPEGATFCFLPAEYRIARQLWPKSNQIFLGQDGTIINGAEIISFTQDGDTWVSTGHTQEPTPAVTKCADGVGDLCNMPFRLFVDGARVKAVASRDQLVPGTFFFDLKDDSVRIADDPAGAVYELAKATLGMVGTRARVPAHGVQVSGIEWRYFANQRIGVISTFEARDWIIENNDVHHSHGCGIWAGTGTQVIGNHVHHMGQLGLCGQGDQILIEGNEIDHNNLSGFHRRWEAGGAKWVSTNGLVVRNNNSHHNKGPGLWTDGNNIQTLYEGNTVEFNTDEGIFHEIGYDAIIRGNTVRKNGRKLGPWGAGILVSSSPNVEIYDNIVQGRWNGILCCARTEAMAFTDHSF